MEIFDKLKPILSELSGIENIWPEHHLLRDLALESIRMVALLMTLEEKFNIVLDESDMNPFDLITVEHVIKLTEKYVGGK